MSENYREDGRVLRRMSKFKVWLVEKVINLLGFGYFVLLHGVDGDEHNGCSLWDGFDIPHLTAILACNITNVPEIRTMVEDALIGHLRRYEVDCKNFLEKLNKKD